MSFLPKLFAALLLAPAIAWSQADYAREKRWADEILPAVLVGDPVQVETGSGRKFLGLYATSAAAAPGVIVVHGRGMHPDWSVTNALRTQLSEQGYATLSIQMPVLASDAPAERYALLNDEAADRLAAAVRFLRGKGHPRIAIVSHSLGARMANHFLERTPAPEVDAWVAIGMMGRYTGAEHMKLPVLDIYGERDWPEVRDHAAARAESLRRLRGSAQIDVPGADHFFAGHESALVRHVRLFLDQRLK